MERMGRGRSSGSSATTKQTLTLQSRELLWPTDSANRIVTSSDDSMDRSALVKLLRIFSFLSTMRIMRRILQRSFSVSSLFGAACWCWLFLPFRLDRCWSFTESILVGCIKEGQDRKPRRTFNQSAHHTVIFSLAARRPR